MSTDRDVFLRVTFGGGRFAAHVMPVDVLAELATLQQVVLEIARQEFKARHPERKRVFRGFAEAARLDLSATEANCFTATLTREAAPPLPGLDPATIDVFFAARDRVVSLLENTAHDKAFATVNAKALKLLARLGDRLGDDEWMDLRKQRGASPTRVDHASRARLSGLLRAPLEQFAELDGEVVDITDKGWFSLLMRGRGVVSVWFERTDRADLTDAFDRRPAVRVRARGHVQWTSPPRMQRVEELDVVDHERRPEIDRVCDRIKSLTAVAPGWLDGDGVAPTPYAMTQAKDVLARLLADHADVPRPQVFPTPDGGVQAEWILGRVAAEVRFPPQLGPIEADATHADSDAGSERSFAANEITCDDSDALAQWLKEARALPGGDDVHEARA